MDNKYYAPSIEEFHVGFEYEILVDFGKIKGSQWVSTKINSWYDSLENETRVKYLDKEDIESLGWKLKEDSKNNFVKFINNTYYFLNLQDNNISIVYAFNENPGLLFHFFVSKITIKNKSELKKLLIQLGIYE